LEASAEVATHPARHETPAHSQGELEAKMDLSQKWIRLIGRLALGAIFLLSVAGKLTNWSGTVAYAATKGVPQVLLAGATALELVGVVLLLTGFKTRWGAAALVVFLVPVTLVFHDFWAVQGAQHHQQLVEFLKNVAIAGGLLVEFVAGPGAFSLDARARTGPDALLDVEKLADRRLVHPQNPS
jgi:putative oxidoreductase